MKNQNARTITGISIITLYAAGLIALVLGQARLGLFLWVVSTVGGMAWLYYLRLKKEKEEALKESSQADREDGV
ncbi:MAG: hypothetical protein IKE30_04155 [Clostridia bacterium]|nr:hypothetical protein [Clostridia bacterium]